MRPTKWLCVQLLVLAIDPAAAMAGPCESLQLLQLPQTTITSARVIPAGAFLLPADAPRASSDFFTAFGKLREFCRVEGILRPSNDSHIELEVWLPTSGWNNKYVGAGNGGFSGSINYYRMAEAISAGYAASATDAGHKSDVNETAWAVGHPEKVVDFDHRAVHETAQKAKHLIEAFYGRPIAKSYFNSCSNGGRQGLTEAVMYPADYDGILAGAPAIMAIQFDRTGHFSADRTSRHLLDLTAFKNRGGKIVIYHGTNDAPQPTIDYYNTLIAKFGQDAVEQFVKLFVIPEMGHCGGGPVPDFGARLSPPSDAEHGLFPALERWVERGIAPASITATKFTIDGEPASGVMRTRPLCAFPRRAQWNGRGSEDAAANYGCVVPAPYQSSVPKP